MRITCELNANSHVFGCVYNLAYIPIYRTTTRYRVRHKVHFLTMSANIAYTFKLLQPIQGPRGSSLIAQVL